MGVAGENSAHAPRPITGWRNEEGIHHQQYQVPGFLVPWKYLSGDGGWVAKYAFCGGDGGLVGGGKTTRTDRFMPSTPRVLLSMNS